MPGQSYPMAGGLFVRINMASLYKAQSAFGIRAPKSDTLLTRQKGACIAHMSLVL